MDELQYIENISKTIFLKYSVNNVIKKQDLKKVLSHYFKSWLGENMEIGLIKKNTIKLQKF